MIMITTKIMMVTMVSAPIANDNSNDTNNKHNKKNNAERSKAPSLRAFFHSRSLEEQRHVTAGEDEREARLAARIPLRRFVSRGFLAALPHSAALRLSSSPCLLFSGVLSLFFLPSPYPSVLCLFPFPLFSPVFCLPSSFFLFPLPSSRCFVSPPSVVSLFSLSLLFGLSFLLSCCSVSLHFAAVSLILPSRCSASASRSSHPLPYLPPPPAPLL